MKEGFKKMLANNTVSRDRQKETAGLCNYIQAFDSMPNAVALSTL